MTILLLKPRDSLYSYRSLFIFFFFYDRPIDERLDQPEQGRCDVNIVLVLFGTDSPQLFLQLLLSLCCQRTVVSQSCERRADTAVKGNSIFTSRATCHIFRNRRCFGAL